MIPWLSRLVLVGATPDEGAAITASYYAAAPNIQAALTTLIGGIDNSELLVMLNGWRSNAGPFQDGFPGGGLPFGTGVAVLTGDTADDGEAISAGTGLKLALTGGLTSAVVITASDSPFSASPGQLVNVDASDGDVAVVLPSTPPEGSLICVQMIARGTDPTRLAPSQVTISGPDPFRPGYPDYLTDLFAPTTVRFASDAVVWDVTNVSQSKVGLDALYVSQSDPGPVTGSLLADVIGTNGAPGINPAQIVGWISYAGPPVGPSPRPDGSWQSGDIVLGPGAAVYMLNQGVWVGGTGGSTPPPSVVTLPATPFTQTTATLNGTINPNNQVTTYQFEYGPTTAYGTTVPGSPGAVGSDDTVHALSADITGLTASTPVHFRINAIVGGVTTNGADQTFTTLPTSPAPTVGTGFVVGSPTSSTATVGAPVNPNGALTGVVVNYGPTTSYGTVSPPTGSQNAGSGNTLENIEFNLTGLTPGQAYHAQVVATNTNGSTDSADFTFTAAAGAAPGPGGAPVIS